MKLKTVLICDNVHDCLLTGLKDMGYHVLYNKEIRLNEVEELLPELYGIVINSKTIMNASRIKLGTNLKFIARLGSGLEIIDQEYAAKKNVKVFNSPEGNRLAVAEHALGMLLSLLNKLHTSNLEVKDFNWQREKNRGRQLSGSIIGIIGFGHTGSSFARLLSGFDVEVLTYDKYKNNYVDALPHVKEVSLQEVLKRSDILSFHLPLSDETLHFFNHNMSSKLRRGTILINTSRGAVIDTESLIIALENGTIGGACLDVFENEKPATYSYNERLMYEKLFLFEQVITSPHVAGWTQRSLEKIAQILLKKIATI